jgi:hypothetical protein
MAADFLLALVVASLIMIVAVFVGVAITMPFHGAVIRWVQRVLLGVWLRVDG